MHLGVFNIDSNNAYKLTKGNQFLSLNFIFHLKQKKKRKERPGEGQALTTEMRTKESWLNLSVIDSKPNQGREGGRERT